VTYLNRIALPILSMAVALVGCNRDDGSIKSYAAPKEAPPSAVASGDQQMPGGQQPAGAEAADSTPSLKWTLPSGWKQTAGASEMRYATIDAGGAPLTITPLGAEAGQLLPNVVRWAGQLGVQNVTEADLPKYTQATQVSGEQAQLVDITGPAANGQPAQRLLAAIIPHDGRVWFVKLTAPDSVAAAQKSNFDAFVHSLEFSTDRAAGAQAAAPSQSQQVPAMPPAGGGGAAHPSQGTFRLASWKAPEGWTEQPGANAMRVTSFRVGTGAETAEVIVSRIPQGGAGSFQDNINRWRGQAGLEPTNEQKTGEMQSINVAGHQALFLSFTGPEKQVLVSMDVEGSDFWFVKLVGPKAVVSGQENAFRQFLASMQFVPESK
jgi:hypothetical protein